MIKIVHIIIHLDRPRLLNTEYALIHRRRRKLRLLLFMISKWHIFHKWSVWSREGFELWTFVKHVFQKSKINPVFQQTEAALEQTRRANTVSRGLICLQRMWLSSWGLNFCHAIEASTGSHCVSIKHTCSGDSPVANSVIQTAGISSAKRRVIVRSRHEGPHTHKHTNPSVGTQSR